MGGKKIVRKGKIKGATDYYKEGMGDFHSGMMCGEFH